jgi:hypothetical protein
MGANQLNSSTSVNRDRVGKASHIVVAGRVRTSLSAASRESRTAATDTSLERGMSLSPGTPTTNHRPVPLFGDARPSSVTCRKKYSLFEPDGSAPSRSTSERPRDSSFTIEGALRIASQLRGLPCLDLKRSSLRIAHILSTTRNPSDFRFSHLSVGCTRSPCSRSTDLIPG